MCNLPVAVLVRSPVFSGLALSRSRPSLLHPHHNAGVTCADKLSGHRTYP